MEGENSWCSVCEGEHATEDCPCGLTFDPLLACGRCGGPVCRGAWHCEMCDTQPAPCRKTGHLRLCPGGPVAECPACEGEGRAACALCGGTGFVGDAVFARWLLKEVSVLPDW